MRVIDTVIIGGGQAGLAMSYCLAAEGIDHVVFERGEVAQSWRGHWDSLRLLTPNWQSRLPGFSYRGAEPQGFMSRDELVAHLEAYRRVIAAPVQCRTSVLSLWEPEPGRFLVETTRGRFMSRSVVIATGECGRPWLPGLARDLAPSIEQLTPASYKRPDQLPLGGVLVVGASSTGVQLAREIRASGRPVTLAVGRHVRLPRRYRGRDIMAWLDAIGVWTESAECVPDLAAARAAPSLQLVGSDDDRDIDLGVLRAMGVRIVGKLVAARDQRVQCAQTLPFHMNAAEGKLRRLLGRIDDYISRRQLSVPEAASSPELSVPLAPSSIDLRDDGIQTVLWATGYERSYPWLHVPVLDDHGQLIHDGGVTPRRGLYVLGLRFMRRRNSNFIDGVGHDARYLALQISEQLAASSRAA